MLKFIYHFIIEFVDITDNEVIDFVLFWIITGIAFVVAYKFVGLTKEALGYNSKLMSTVHWVVRIGLVLGLIWVIRQIFALIVAFLALQWWVIALSIIGVIVLISIVVFIYRYYF